MKYFTNSAEKIIILFYVVKDLVRLENGLSIYSRININVDKNYIMNSIMVSQFFSNRIETNAMKSPTIIETIILKTGEVL